MFENFSELGLGTSNLASFGRALSFKKAKNLIDQAIDAEIKTFDTADAYASGDTERLIGRIIQNKRDKIFIISKVGLPYIDFPEFLSPLNQFGKKILQTINIKKNYSSKYILSNIKKSLRRLNTEYLDAYLLHDFTISDNLEYKDECFEALYKIKKQGLSKYIGVSSNDKQTLNFSIKNGNIDIIQTKIDFSNSFEESFKEIKDYNYKLIVNSIFRQKLNDNKMIKFNSLLKNFQIPKEDKNLVLLAYCLQKNNVSCAIFGTKNLSHLYQIAKGYKNYKYYQKELFEKLNEIFI